MAISLKKALLAYDRQDTALINCGGDWVVEIKPYSSAMKEMSRQQAKLRASGVIKDKKKKDNTTQSIALLNPMFGDLLNMDEDEEHFLLGSFETDIKFFVHNIIVSWTGLEDDKGDPIPYTAEIAIEMFLENGEPSRRLYRELLACSLDSQRFMKTIEEQVSEDSKN